MNFYIHTFGCKVNIYESEYVTNLLLEKGYKMLDWQDEEEADIYIINTCTVTNVADKKDRKLIHTTRRIHKDAILIVMGCYSQGNSSFIANDIKADIIVGTSHRNEIPDLIEEFKKNKQQIVKTDKNVRALCYEELGVTSYSENTRAYLKIQDGCNIFCS